nr:uncharacterized protein LOC104109267 isoform X2 [Nicotiana tomentosiformis]
MTKLELSLLENERISTEIFRLKIVVGNFQWFLLENQKHNVKYFLIVFRPYSDNVSLKVLAQKYRLLFCDRFGRFLEVKGSVHLLLRQRASSPARFWSRSQWWSVDCSG